MHDLTKRLAGLSPQQRALLEEKMAGAAGAARPVTRALGERPRLSFAQQRLWFIDQLDPGNPAYNLAYSWQVTGPLDRSALATAFAAVLARHDVLRTCFPSSEGEPWQQVTLEAGAELTVIDLTGHTADARAAELQAVTRSEATHRFDLSTGPLVRARLVATATDEHYLLLTVHHIVADAWSILILMRDLLAAYDVATGESTTSLPALPLNYRQVAAAERDRVDSDAGRGDLAYWREQLRDLPEIIELVTDRPRPVQASLRGGRVEFRLDAAQTAAVQRVARAYAATPFAVLLAAYSVLLARYAGQDDIAVGVPVAARNSTALEEMVGLFLNTAVLRTDLSGDPAFGSLVRTCADNVMTAFDHHQVPFDALVNELVAVRDLGRNPLFQVMLSFNNTPPIPVRTPRLRFEYAGADRVIAKFDLNLIINPEADTLHCTLSYATDLFDEARMVGLARHFQALLAAATAEPGLRVSQLPIMDDGEHVAIEAWNSTDTDYELRPLPELVAAQVARTPRRPAVGSGGRWLDYATFADDVGRLARRLRREGVHTDAIVGVLLHRGTDMVTALHGVVAAGGAYLPLEPDYPDERLAWMVRDAGAHWVLTTTDLADRLPSGVRVLCLDAMDDTDDSPSEAPPGVPLDALAYVIYTSGSTGTPKAVGVSHRAIANRLRWMQQAFPLTSDDVVLHKTPFSFDVSVWELFWPLTVGASMSVAKPGGHRDSRYLADALAADEISTAHFVPSMLGAFLEEADLARRLPALRRVFASGEALTTDLVARFRGQLPDVELHNLYGPTEAAVDVSWQPCGELPAEAAVPIGRPVANTRLEVLDDRLQRVPVGVAGELCIGGVQLARGYLGRPQWTAERFVPDPFGPASSRLYRTGDIAVRRPDGALEYRGRRDGQVKLHGLRIELGEIEARLTELPEVTSAAVAVRDDKLIAYIVLAGDTPRPDWSAQLRRHLPGHMIPHTYVELERLPTTASGKLHRAALPAPSATGAGADRREPAGIVEEAVADVWRAVLGTDRISAEDDFFAVGGDSIRSLKVVARLRAAGYEVGLQDLFVHPTLSELARAMSRSEPGSAPADQPEPDAFSMINPTDMAGLRARRKGWR